MSVKATLDPDDEARLHRSLTPSLYIPPIETLLHSASSFAVREIERDAPKDTGGIAHSFAAEVRGLEATITSHHPGAAAENFGRRAGGRVPPSNALEAWASSHGLEGLAFVIARAIARRGTRGRFYIQRTVERLHNYELPTLLQTAANQIEARWGRL